MDRVVLVLVAIGGVLWSLFPAGQSVEERQTGHLKSAVAGIVARASLASGAVVAMQEPAQVKQPAAAPAAAAPAVAKPRARVLICSPTWHCTYCDVMRPNVEALTKRGWTVGKAADDDYQFVTLADDEARKLYGITRWPSVVYLDSSGKMVKKSTGVQSTATLENELKALRK